MSDSSSISVVYDADITPYLGKLGDMSGQTDETADDIQKNLDKLHADLDTDEFDRKLKTAEGDSDKLGDKKPTPKVGLGTEDFDKNRKIVDTELDDLDKRDSKPKLGLDKEGFEKTKVEVDEQLTLFNDKEVKAKVGLEKAADFDAEKEKILGEADENSAHEPKIPVGLEKSKDFEAEKEVIKEEVKREVGVDEPKIPVGVKESDDFNEKLEAIKKIAEALTKNGPKLDVGLKLSDKQFASLVKGDVDSLLKNDEGGGGGGGGKTRLGSGSSGGAKKAAEGLDKDLADKVLGFMGKASILPAALGASTVVTGAASALGAALINLVLGAGAFDLALTGSKNPVKINFEKQTEGLLTKYDKAMAPYTAKALNSLLSPMSQWLTDVAPVTKGFAQGLSEMATSLDQSLKSKGVQKIFAELGSETTGEMKDLGPVLANALSGIGQLVVAAQPVISELLGGGLKGFASAGAFKTELKVFSDLAGDMKQFGPELGDSVDLLVRAISKLMAAAKPLEGPSFKLLEAGLTGLGNFFQYVSDFEKDLPKAIDWSKDKPILGNIVSFLDEIGKAISSSGIGKGVGEAGSLALVLGAFEKTRKLEIAMGKLAVKGVGGGVSALEGLVGKLAGHLPGASKLESLIDKLNGSGSASSPTATLNTAADNMLKASETMERAADKMSSAGTKQETAGGEEVTAGGEEEAAGLEQDAAAGGKLGSLVKGLGPLLASQLGSTIGSGLLGAAGAGAIVLALGELAKATGGPQYSGKTGTYSGGSAGSTRSQVFSQDVWSIASGNGIPQQELQYLTPKERTELTKLEADYKKGGKQAGDALVKALEQELKSDKPDKAAEKQAQNVIDAVKKKYGIKSPSKVFMEIGQNINTGLAQGLLKDDTALANMVKVSDALQNKLKDTLPQYLALGESIDTQIAAGITANSAAVQAALGSVTAKASGLGGGGTGNSTVNLYQSINVNVAGTNATTSQIVAAVQQGIQQAETQMVAGLRGIS